MMEQLEQLWYTWSTVGLGGVTGFRVRAASNGVADINSERYKALNAHLLYKLPYGSDLYQSTMETSPICLAYLEAGNECVALQKVFAGQDAYGRAGIYFVHLLASLPETFVASDAIALWKSSFWQTSEQRLPPTEVTLPPLSRAALAAGALGIDDMVEVEDYVEFAIQAFLSLGKGRRLYLVAPDKTVATLIWAILQSVPRSLQTWQKLTFSTYEHDVTKSTARIVGTSYPLVPQQLPDGSVRPPQDIPPEYYTTKGLALNVYTKKPPNLSQGMGQQEEYQRLAAYARFASQCLLEGRKQELDELVEVANKIDAHEVSDLLFVYKLLSTPQLSATDITDLLQSEVLVKAFLTTEHIQQQVLDLASSDPNWLKEQGLPALTQLVSFGGKLGPELSIFAERAAQELGKAMVLGDQPMVTATYSLLNTLASAEQNPTPWAELLREMSTHPSFTPTRLPGWDTRRWLLERWIIAARQVKIDDALIRPWLVMTWNELEQLPELKPTEQWYIIAVMSLIASGQPVPENAVKILASYGKYFEDAIEHLMQQRAMQAAVVRFFEALVKRKYEGKLALLRVLLNGEGQTVEDGEHILRAARLTFQEKMAVLEAYHEQVLQFRDTKHFAPAVEDMITQYISTFTLEHVLDVRTHPMLHVLNAHTALLPQKVGALARNWNFAADGVQTERPTLTFERASLEEMGKAIVSLHLHTEKSYLERLYRVLIRTVGTEEQLRCAVESLGPALGGKAHLLSTIVAFWSTKYQRGTDHTLLVPYVTLMLAYAHMMKATDKERFLGPLFALMKRTEKKTFEDLDRESLKWSEKLQEEWKRYSTDLRPTTFVEKVGGAVKGSGFPFLPTKRPPVEVIKSNTGRQPASSAQPVDAPTPVPADMSYQQSPTAESAKPRTTQSNAGSERTAAMPGGTVAIVDGQPISDEDFVTTYKVYRLYMLYRQILCEQDMKDYFSKLEKNKKKRNYEHTHEFNEIQSKLKKAREGSDYWYNLLNEEVVKRHQVVREKLIDDALLRRWLTKYATNDVEKSLQRIVESHVTTYCGVLKTFDKNGTLFKEKKEEDIKKALRVIFRPTVIADHLKEQGLPLSNVLNIAREGIVIRRSEHLERVSD